MPISGVLHKVATLLSDLFSPGALLSPSDVLVGLMLVERKQPHQRVPSGYVPVSRRPPVQMAHTAVACNEDGGGVAFHREFGNVVHFVEYAGAIYGFPLFMFGKTSFPAPQTNQSL